MSNIESIKFNNKIFTIDNISLPITENDIKTTPQLYRYSANNALDLQNPIISSFVHKCNIHLDPSFGYKYTSLDTRVHMLKPTMMPCISGWHCDDFYRGENGQPLLKDIDIQCPQRHYICTIGNTSLPQFIIPDLTLDIDTNAVYKSLNQQIKARHLDEDTMGCDIYQPKSGEIIKIGPSAIHRGIPANKAGWRLFMRLTYSNHRQPKNEIRTQTQVYLTNMDGW